MSIDVKKYVNDYKFNCTLPGTGEKIVFKPITTGQLKSLLIYEGADDAFEIEDALDELITGCVVSEDFVIDDQYLQDRFFLLLEIRKKSKGETYSFIHRCTKCNQDIATSINLDDLEVIPINEDRETVFKFNENLSVEMGFITRGMQKQAQKFVRELGQLSEIRQVAELATYSYAISITKFVTPDGESTDVSIEDRIFILNNTDDSTGEKFRKWFDDYTFGVDFTFKIKCRHCSNKEKMTIPLASFFA